LTKKGEPFMSDSLITALQDCAGKRKAETKPLSMGEYIEEVKAHPGVAAGAHRRVYDMIRSYGVKTDSESGDETYLFFERELFGIETSIREVMEYFKGSAMGSDVAKRFLLVYGPPSSGKSNLVSMIKDAMEAWSHTDEGAVYAITGCPMNEEPLHAIPKSMRPQVEKELGVTIEGELCPLCAMRLRDDFKGDFMKFPVKRVYFSQQSRLGLGTFVPSDPKCVVGDTLLVSDEGLISFDELQTQFMAPEDEFVDVGIVVSGFKGTEKASKFYNGGVKPCVKVTTRLGLSVEGSTKHPVMCFEDGKFAWKRISEVKVGDFVVSQFGSNVWGNKVRLPELSRRVGRGPNKDLTIPSEMTMDLASFLGYLISEGAICDDGVWFSNADLRLVEDYERCVKKVFGIEPHRYDPRSGKSTFDVLVSSMDIVAWLSDELGIRRGSANKDVPECIRSAPKEIVMSFVAALSWGDGTIGCQGSKLSNRYRYVSVSDRLSKQLQLILLNAGIVASYYEEKVKYEGEYRDVYAVQVTGDSVLDMVAMVRGLEDKSLVGLVSKTGKTNILMMPNMIKDARRVLDKVKKSMGAYKYSSQYSIMFDKYKRAASDAKWSRRMNRSTMESFVKAASPHVSDSDLKPFREILEREDLMYLEVVSVEDIGDRQVYDLMVPGTHSFCANGLVCHNSQDVSELIGSVDLSKIGEFGTESDPRAYKFDGELNVSNRGIMEFIEILKVDQKFLYVLLTATQEKVIKTPRFPLISCDEVILSHTNESEYKEFVGNPKNEALIDRMIVCRIPYNLRVKDEVRIYEKLLKTKGLAEVHVAPHTLRVAAMFSVLSRIEDPKDQTLDKVKKMKLYDGEEVEGFSLKDVPRLMKESFSEGMDGVSPRYIINRLVTTAIHGLEEEKGEAKEKAADFVETGWQKRRINFITPIHVLRSLKEGLTTSSKFKPEERSRYEDLIALVRKEFDQIAKNEVQKAFFVSFEDEAKVLLDNYIDNVEAYMEKTKLLDPITKEEIEPSEQLMRAIESKIGISEGAKDSFRNEVLRKVAASTRRGENFRYESHGRLREAIEKQLFEDRKDLIKITITSRTKRDPDELKRINQVVDTLCSKHGYIPESANELLKYVSSIMMREK